MKKIIKNKMYDTATAKPIASYDVADEGRTYEQLYRKKTGEYFLFSDVRFDGWNITPVSYEQAREWAQLHMTSTAYDDVFGDIKESDELARLHISCTQSEADRIRKAAQQNGMTISEYILSRV